MESWANRHNTTVSLQARDDGAIVALALTLSKKAKETSAQMMLFHSLRADNTQGKGIVCATPLNIG